MPELPSFYFHGKNIAENFLVVIFTTFFILLGLAALVRHLVNRVVKIKLGNISVNAQLSELQLKEPPTTTVIKNEEPLAAAVPGNDSLPLIALNVEKCSTSLSFEELLLTLHQHALAANLDPLEELWKIQLNELLAKDAIAVHDLTFKFSDDITVDEITTQRLSETKIVISSICTFSAQVQIQATATNSPSSGFLTFNYKLKNLTCHAKFTCDMQSSTADAEIRFSRTVETEAVIESGAMEFDSLLCSLLQGHVKDIIAKTVHSYTIDCCQVVKSQDLAKFCEDSPEVLNGNLSREEEHIEAVHVANENLQNTEQPTEIFSESTNHHLQVALVHASPPNVDSPVDVNEPEDSPEEEETLVVRNQVPYSPTLPLRKIVFVGGHWKEDTDEQILPSQLLYPANGSDTPEPSNRAEHRGDDLSSWGIHKEDVPFAERDFTSSSNSKERERMSSTFEGDSSSLSGMSAVSGSSTRTYLGEDSTLVIEKTIDGVQKHYLVPRGTVHSPKLKKRGKKLHLFLDHIFVARHLPGGTRCKVCGKSLPLRPPPIKQGYECRSCHLRCHKSCHVKVDSQCPSSKTGEMDLKVAEIGPGGKFWFD